MLWPVNAIRPSKFKQAKIKLFNFFNKKISDIRILLCCKWNKFEAKIVLGKIPTRNLLHSRLCHDSSFGKHYVIFMETLFRRTKKTFSFGKELSWSNYFHSARFTLKMGGACCWIPLISFLEKKNTTITELKWSRSTWWHVWIKQIAKLLRVIFFIKFSFCNDKWTNNITIRNIRVIR